MPPARAPARGTRVSLAAGKLVDGPAREREQIEMLQRRMRDLEVVPRLEMERAQMRRASHQHHLEHRELKRDGIFLRNGRDPRRQRATIVGIQRTRE